MEKGWAINIGGGFSHYSTNVNSAGGLAVYDDVLVCLAVSSYSYVDSLYGLHSMHQANFAHDSFQT